MESIFATEAQAEMPSDDEGLTQLSAAMD